MEENMLNVEYIEPKEWNKKLVELNNGERARYYEHTYALEKAPEIPQLTEVPKKYGWEDTSKKVYYTVTVKPAVISVPNYQSGFKKVKLGDWGSNYRVVQGFKVIIKVACRLYLRGVAKESETSTLVERIRNDGCNISYYDDLKPKFTPLAKEVKEKKISEQVLKDKYGVPIEIGDWVAHPSGTYGGGSSVTISQVNTFGFGTVNGWKPERLIVVRSNNEKKELGWGF